MTTRSFNTNPLPVDIAMPTVSMRWQLPARRRTRIGLKGPSAVGLPFNHERKETQHADTEV